MTGRGADATIVSMIPTLSRPITALRAALLSPWPELRDVAARIVRETLSTHTTLERAARALGTNDRGLRRLRRDFRLDKGWEQPAVLTCVWCGAEVERVLSLDHIRKAPANLVCSCTRCNSRALT